MNSVKNFRELGGIRMKDGSKIKYGYFFRSGMLNYISDEDLQQMKELNIQAIVDFRDDYEMGGFDIRSKLDVEYHNHPIKLNSARICKLQDERTLKNALKPLDKEDMRIAYRNIPLNNDSYKFIVDLIKNDRLPILFHCSVGKDRTGVAAAVILMLLGADREEIVDDYLISQQFEKYIIKFVTSKINFLVRRRIAKSMMPVFLADRSYIEAAIDAILERYGSFEGYLMGEYNLNMEDIITIRAKYTERA